MGEEGIDFIQPTAFQENVADSPPPTAQNLLGKRPTGKIFTTFFTLKVIPYFCYMFSGLIFSSTVFQWVLCIISSSIDFWFTKNVAGRLILGMRWTNVVNDDGTSTWKFEYAKIDMQDKATQRRYFWLILFASTGLWGLFTFFNVIRLSLGWVFVTGISLALSATNAWGFWKCDKSIKNEVQNGASSLFSSKVLPFLINTGQNIINDQVNNVANNVTNPATA